MAEEPAEAWLFVVVDVEGFGATGRDSEGAVDGVVEEPCSETVVASVAPVELLAKMLATLTSGVWGVWFMLKNEFLLEREETRPARTVCWIKDNIL